MGKALSNETMIIIFCLAIAIAAFVISVFSFRGKGILLNNAWLYASKEERRTMDKKQHYRQSGIVFCFIGTVFVLYAVWAMTGWSWIFYLFIIDIAAVMIYAIVSSIRIEKSSL